MAYQVLVNEEHSLTLEPGSKEWDLQVLPNGQIHILYQNRSYTATVLETDTATKTMKLRLGKGIYTLQLKDDFDQLADKMGMGAAARSKANVIKAPMPGLVLSVAVAPGQSLRKGEPVLVLEAMKMENVIKAPADGRVKTVLVGQGNPVDKNQILVELE